jgi:hypothetical protein
MQSNCNISNPPDTIPALSVIYQPVTALAAYPRNARIHSKHQIRQIAASITAFGFANPILVDRENTIVAGHGRLLAAQMLGMEPSPKPKFGRMSWPTTSSPGMPDGTSPFWPLNWSTC